MMSNVSLYLYNVQRSKSKDPKIHQFAFLFSLDHKFPFRYTKYEWTFLQLQLQLAFGSSCLPIRDFGFVL
jgi:hypothetical protein